MRRIFLTLVYLAVPASAWGQTPAETFFETRIRPVLWNTCVKCHGPTKASGGLRLDSRAALLKGGDRGPAIVPGEPARSLLVQAIRQIDADLRMPPKGQLTGAQVADFEAWIKQGAVWPEAARAESPEKAKQHWAFQPVRCPVPPNADRLWPRNPIDQFIAARRTEHGLKPVEFADRRSLARRLYFDLIGLPPRPSELAEYLADDSPDAYERLVERLLSSPQYGERWGRHWMDVIRYADTAGDNADYPIPEIRRYRDYIIQSFNQNKPYHQFVQEQLAGDILARQGPHEQYAERVIATGFLALSRRYATAPYELWNLTLEDTIDTTGRAFLGLTLRCARCHDHKYDPVTRADYYGLYGIFASTQFPWAGAEEFASMKRPRQHFAPLAPAAEIQPRLQAFAAKTKELAAEIAQQETAVAAQDKGPARKSAEETLKRLREELRLLQQNDLPSELGCAYAVQEGPAADAYIQIRGEIDQRGPSVPRDTPRFLSKEHLAIPPGSSGRLQLAQWLTRPDNPLTARVMANRLWQYHFGKGLVATPSNFGLRGEEPTHPELLDWLADRLVRSGWSVKTLQRLIVTSATYRLASGDDAANRARDPANRWYWRFDRHRLDAESLRDAMLAVSGTLDLRRPGSHPFPPMSQWKWTQHAPFKDVYETRKRSVYLMTQRLQRHPYLALFDGPDTNTSTDVRSESTVPLQALYLMNDPFVAELAEAFARRILAETGDVSGRIEFAHQLAWSRGPDTHERERAGHYLTAYADRLAAAGGSPGGLEIEAWASFARILLTANEFMYVD